MRPTFSACNLQYMMRKWTSIATEMWKDRRPIFSSLGFGLCAYEVSVKTATLLCHRPAFPGPQSLMQKDPTFCLFQELRAYSQLCGWWRKESFCIREADKEGQKGISRNSGFKAVLWCCTAVWAVSKKWPHWGVGLDRPLDHYLGYCLGTAPGPWGSSEIVDNFPSLNRLYCWSSLEKMQNSVCAQLSNKLLSNICYSLGTEV